MQLSALLEPIVHLLVQIAGAALATGLVTLCAQAIKAMHIHLSQTQEERLREYAQQAARFAEEVIEEQARKSGAPLAAKGDLKLATAVGFLTSKFPALGVAYARVLIKSQLSNEGVGVSAYKAPVSAVEAVKAEASA